MSASRAGIFQKPHVFRPDELPFKERGAGARTTPLVTAARGATTYLNGITTFEPGAAIGHHTHNVAESVMIIKGRAIVDIDGDRTEVSVFDTTFVPANIPHHFENASDTEEMKILWIYGSLDSTRTILATGETGRIDDEQAGAAAAEPVRVVKELAEIEVKAGHEEAFETAVAVAAPLFQRAKGSRTLTLERSEEFPQRYRLVVGWESVDDHMVTFRQSADFLAWRELIGEHLAAPPKVEHLRNVLTAF
jgi:quercetin dioxygenase-like cupin family protein/quinol monooxygenase YgiN